jgi:hemerythrin-like domain-containing protein
MPVQIGAKPDAGFDNPIGLMKDCHRRVEKFLDILRMVARSAHGRALAEDESQAVESALIYFRSSGPLHSRDEEESLFPRLRAAGAANPLAEHLLMEIAKLEDDHCHAAALHREADEIFSRWCAGGTLTAKAAVQLEFVTGELGRIYSTHIAVEEGLIFPRAAELFTRKELDAMARELRERRNLG